MFLDGNRESRSTVLDWKMEAVGRGNGADALVDGDTDEVGGGAMGLEWGGLGAPGGTQRGRGVGWELGGPAYATVLGVVL